MDLSPYIASLREDLATAASAGDDNTRRTAAALSAALEPAARLAIMNALSDLAAEVTASLEGQVVEVRLAGRDVQVVVTGSAEPEPEPAPHQEVPLGDATGDISRITLRMINELKSKAEAAAAAQGVSLNSFIQQAVGGAVHGKHKHHGHKGWQGNTGSGSRVRGWVQG
ncbi:HicB family protein [Lentzea aerocolonigenes]|uniref:HicB family protein n=1 Tax=Lentzea aerocolonigenes TaxID=68170 RepID=A0A0F0GAH2_LENAE|nr:toxin-antitoxin system HicB family antitoxin [Lentzea aerocolonigenes]KJK33255.1 HicB family protein [Lentzea aerocolonigenes]